MKMSAVSVRFQGAEASLPTKRPSLLQGTGIVLAEMHDMYGLGSHNPKSAIHSPNPLIKIAAYGAKAVLLLATPLFAPTAAAFAWMLPDKVKLAAEHQQHRAKQV